MKIALIIRDFSLSKGGVERYAVHLAEGLLKEGHEVHVFCNSWDSVAPEPLHFHRVPIGYGPNFFKFLLFHFTCQRQLRRQKMDLVYALTQTYPADIYRMCDGLYRQRISSLYPTTSKRFFRYISRPIYLLNILWEKKIIGGAGCQFLIANSNVGAEPIQAFYAFPPERIAVIYNGVDLNTFHPGVKSLRSKIRKTYGIDEDAPLLLFSSMDFARKGLAELIHSLASVRKIFPNIRLLVVGKGNAKPYVTLAKEQGVEDVLRFAGHVSNSPAYYGAADLFVLPTHYDPFANVCLEAMACGIPVITTRRNGASELIQDGVNGYTIAAPGEAGALTRAIQLALTDRSDQNLGEKAAETARNFSHAAHIRSVLAVCERISQEKVQTEVLCRAPFLLINRAFRSIFDGNQILSYDAITRYGKGTGLRRGKARTTLFRLADGAEEKAFYIKRHLRSSFSGIFKRVCSFFLFGLNERSESRREWNRILSFRRAGLPTMVPVAMGEKGPFFRGESFLITEALRDYEPLDEWIPAHYLSLSPENQTRLKADLIRAVALLARRMHDAGFYHRDFYFTHLFLKKTPDGIDLRMIDLQRVLKDPWFKRRWMVKDLAALNYASPGGVLTARDRLFFYKCYGGVSRLSWGDKRLVRTIQKKTERIAEHTEKMRRRREKRKHV